MSDFVHFRQSTMFCTVLVFALYTDWDVFTGNGPAFIDDVKRDDVKRDNVMWLINCNFLNPSPHTWIETHPQNKWHFRNWVEKHYSCFNEWVVEMQKVVDARAKLSTKKECDLKFRSTPTNEQKSFLPLQQFLSSPRLGNPSLWWFFSMVGSRQDRGKHSAHADADADLAWWCWSLVARIQES